MTDGIAALEHRLWLQLNHLDHKMDTVDHQRWLEANHISIELRALGPLEHSIHKLTTDVQALAEMHKELLLQIQVAQRTAAIGDEVIASAIQELANRLAVYDSQAGAGPGSVEHRGRQE